MRGIIGKKIGMTQLFLESGECISATAIEAGPCTVIQVKTREKDGYDAVQLGFGSSKRLNKAEKGHLRGLSDSPFLHEFRVPAGTAEVGERVDVGIMAQGDLLKVSGQSKGRGFAGVVKRYHFRGGPKTHGQSDRHRAPGSVGAGTFPGRVLKGKRMAGHMGDDKVTALNLKVVGVDAERNVLWVRGAVPGANGGLVIVEKVGE
ncbi:MAG: 50S ribosomal protein L3 [Dehalococcoidia bacterium]|nr:MAG: 50S ribosomal protein L3 [Dehalococcoidia bacterium]